MTTEQLQHKRIMLYNLANEIIIVQSHCYFKEILNPEQDAIEQVLIPYVIPYLSSIGIEIDKSKTMVEKVTKSKSRLGMASFALYPTCGDLTQLDKMPIGRSWIGND